ncbi:unnamed protein product [Somion occarium]|uniref:C2H2-type domain-containing protein n=2 Tax=Somion occarium TaxID=3059160 RepID=A0ABP1CSI2_9APHY
MEDNALRSLHRCASMAYCDRCDRYFNSGGALGQHQQNSSAHHICDDCDRDFTIAAGLISHYVNSSAHHYCESCELDFDDEDDLEDHYEEDHCYCGPCGRFFSSEQALDSHNREKHRLYCKPCERTFQSQNSLDNHLRSSIHQSRRIKCPGRHCSASFVTEAGLVQHCESGACPSGVTRQAVNRAILAIDRGNIITNPSKLIGYSSSSVTKTWATDRSWNGDGFECFLCHKEFKKLSGLNMHLKGPAHEQDIYKCPPDWEGCRAEFKTLSGLMQHVESGCCGVKRFKKRLRNAVDEMTSTMRMLTF